MNHLPHLISDLALILGAAAIMTLLFKKMKQPLVLGYIIAGILVSPNFTLLPSIMETKSVNVWAEIGVIFLLFSLGLEFSFRKLVQVGGSASVSAFVEAIGMSALGYACGQVLGWSAMDSIYLGAALAVSSTTIIIKAVEELGLKKKKFATLVFGILIVEDLITIAILVLLTTLSVSRQFVGTEMLLSILKLIFFLILWFVTGIFFIPTILKKAKNLMSDETLLIVSIAMCLLMVYLAAQAGFSPALGAFIMGSLLAETTKAERIEHLVKPVKDLFGAIFFVSVGMLIDVKMIGDYVVPIILITVICILGKVVTTGVGAFISGNSLKVSLQTGMSLAQIGEFSFIIAALGLSLNVTSNFLYPVIVAVSGITTFTTPYLIKAGAPLYNWIDKRLPEKWRASLNRYSSDATIITAANDFQQVVKSFIINVVLFSVLVGAIVYLSSVHVKPWVASHTSYAFGGITAAVVTLLLMAPFLWGLVVRNERNESFAKIYAQQKYRGPIWLMRGIKLSLALFSIIFLLNRFFSLAIALYAAIFMISLFAMFRKKIQVLYDSIESRFIKNLNDRELQAELKQLELQAGKRNVELAPWDAHMTTFEVEPEVNIIGKTLEELRWRELIGVNVAMIKRGQITITTPQKIDRIFPGDRLFIICTDAQEKKMNAILRPDKKLMENQKETEVELDKFTIDFDSPFIHKTIRDSGIRTSTNGLVVGIERNGQRLLNPESSTTFELGDIVWIVGEKKLIHAIN
ncbi:cation:proton antiporter domain-containing protein [Terrimonas pollutisoli]|uniref:cation:proton antiporter domain-containing protein n=1 Tax=Terrimonas pollutisoli TaxID=3034147 RepID=UPI0023EB27CC|nr:cation:proton antiporter [Terrimonas sp. H1YJ31]